MPEQKQTRTIPAPSNSNGTKPGALHSINLPADQDVIWTWTHYPDGTSAVTGYCIVPRTLQGTLSKA